MPLVAHLAQHLIREVCNHETTVYAYGEHITMSAGQMITGRIKLAQETGLSERNIRTGLKVLEKCDFLTSEVTSKYTIITVLNYNVYQSKKEEGDQLGDQSPTRGRPGTDHNTRRDKEETKKVKEKINKKEKPQYSVNFEKIWARYPAPIGKKEAFTRYKRSVKDQDDYDAIHRALDIYLATDRVKNGIIQNGSTWFKRWRDYLELAQRQTQETTSRPSTPAQDDRKVQTQRFEQFIRQSRSLQDIADYILDNTEWEQDYYDAIEKKKGLKALAHIKRLVIGERQQLTAELRAVTAGIVKEM